MFWVFDFNPERHCRIVFHAVGMEDEVRLETSKKKALVTEITTFDTRWLVVAQTGPCEHMGTI